MCIRDSPFDLVERLARAKAAAVAKEHAEEGEPVVAADTIDVYKRQLWCHMHISIHLLLDLPAVPAAAVLPAEPAVAVP